MALALIPILGAMGMAAEASNWWLTQRAEQHAADSAALAAAIDAGTSYVSNGNSFTTSVPTNCTTATTYATAWYCQAKAAAAKFGFTDGSANVTVTPVALTSGCPAQNQNGTYAAPAVCYKVTVTKAVTFNLMNLVGFHGNTTVGGVNAQLVTAVAIADASGPPVDFCVLTTDGDISANGTNSANLRGCDTFSNGNTNCNGNGIQSGYSFASGSTASGTCTISGSNGKPNQNYICDPYGPTTQTFPDNDGSSGTFTESCPNSTNISNDIPPAPAGCNSSTAGTIDGYDGTSSFPSSNVITQQSLNGTATGANAASNATTMTIGGASMSVIQVCGTASFSNTTPTGSTGNPASCTGTLSYTGTTSNLVIIVYDGGLDMNGCTLQSAESTSSGGGVTIIFAPPTATANSVCPGFCVPQTANGQGSNGTIDISAPMSGPFSGLALMQSANFASDSGCAGGNSGKGGPDDWCGAGNTPTVEIQGLVYMPNADIKFNGAISKFTGTGALTCTGWIIKSFETSGTGSILNNTWGSASITGQCTQAGATLPSVPGTHLYYQALVG